MKTAIYPGSFDPATMGHLDIIKRSSRLVDKLIVGVLDNNTKHPLFSAEDRVSLLKIVTKDIPNVEVEAFHGLLVDFADLKEANVIVRGLRAVTDFEYELQLAQLNHKINSRVDTLFLTTSVEYSYLSSSIVKEIAHYGGSIHGLVPDSIIDIVYEKYKIQ